MFDRPCPSWERIEEITGWLSLGGDPINTPNGTLIADLLVMIMYLRKALEDCSPLLEENKMLQEIKKLQTEIIEKQQEHVVILTGDIKILTDSNVYLRGMLDNLCK